MGIGIKIRELRLRAGLTQGELAQKTGVTPSAIGNYEHDVSFPKEEALMKLFKALDCTPNELLGYEREYSESESSHLKMYKLLDEHGRELVDACIEIEFRRCHESPGEYPVPIAARKGEAPHKIQLKKRGEKSILDAPSYRGGRR